MPKRRLSHPYVVALETINSTFVDVMSRTDKYAFSASGNAGSGV